MITKIRKNNVMKMYITFDYMAGIEIETDIDKDDHTVANLNIRFNDDANTIEDITEMLDFCTDVLAQSIRLLAWVKLFGILNLTRTEKR